MFSRIPSSATQTLRSKRLHVLLLGRLWNVLSHTALSPITESLWSPTNNIFLARHLHSLWNGSKYIFPAQFWRSWTVISFLSMLPRFIRLVLKLTQEARQICAECLYGEGPAPPWSPGCRMLSCLTGTEHCRKQGTGTVWLLVGGCFVCSPLPGLSWWDFFPEHA